MGEIVFITGTSSGIGQTLARRYAVQGVMIELVTRRVDILHKFVQMLSASVRSRCHCYAADVHNAESMRGVTDVFIATAGLPSVVIISAGILVGMDLYEPDDLKAFVVVVDTNWMGVFNTFRLFVGPMLARARPGRLSDALVDITSVMGVHGLSGAAAYSASKSTVIKLMEGLHVEFDPLELRMVTIAPGCIRMPMAEHNPYPIPFLMPMDHFVLRAVNVIHCGVCSAVLPWPMGMVVRPLHVLPRRLYDFAFACAGREPRNPEISSWLTPMRLGSPMPLSTSHRASPA